MTFLRRLLYRPRSIWIRRLNFQVHLWTGIVLALYMIIMGVTGSILVFQGELETAFGLIPWHSIRATQPFVPISAVIRNVKAVYPRARFVSLTAPTDREPVYSAVLHSRTQITVAVHPNTGQVLGEVPDEQHWLTYVERLHISLFVPRNGRIPNGIGAAFLLLMCFTGLVNWWPGVRNWRRAVKVDLRRSGARINFDLHSAVGFWSLSIILVWAVSGIYFAWPRQVFDAVNRISPIVNAKPRTVTVVPQSSAKELDLDRLMFESQAIDPGAEFRQIVFPYGPRAPLEILMRRGPGAGQIYEDTLYFDPYTGAHLATWKYGINKTLGDWFIWLQRPVHFGIYWGLGVKILWALLGLAIPVLAGTGLLMYWNRSLRKKWKQLQKSNSAPISVSS